MNSIEVIKNIVLKQADASDAIDPKLLPKSKKCSCGCGGCESKKLIMTEK